MSDQIEEDADRLAATLRRMAAVMLHNHSDFGSVRNVLVNYGLTDRLIDWILEEEEIDG